MDKRRCCSVTVILVLVFHVFSLKAQDLRRGPIDLQVENDRFYLTFSDSILGQKIMVISRSAKGSAPSGQYGEGLMMRGADLQQTVIELQRGTPGTIHILESLPHIRRTQNDSTLHIAATGIGQLPVLAQLTVLPSDVKQEIRVDITHLMVHHASIFGISNNTKSRYKLESYYPDQSRYIRKEQFDRGMDIRFLRTFLSAGSYKSVEINTTLLLLDAEPMKERFADNRVTAMDFSTLKYLDMDVYPYQGQEKLLAKRYRIRPRPQDYQHYLAGDLVEPQQPIVFYIDPATPEDLIPYFERGILSWNKAFEQAGFKNVIQIGRIPANDSTFNFVSARYNALDYVLSPNYGGNADVLLDPVTGEILTSRIYWPHGNGRYLRNQYLVQGGAVDPAVRKMDSDIELIGRLSEVVVAHEMGHCLGLHHNYLSSSLVPVEKLRDKDWVELHGISPSIMDYSRHNYVAQPDDQITLEGMIPKIGAYDRWAIEWLYTWFNNTDPWIEKLRLDSIYLRKISEDPTVAYLNVDYFQDDHRVQMEDVGDNPLLASAYGIENLKRVVPNILEWTKTSSGDYNFEEAMDVYLAGQSHFQHLIQHVANLVGGRFLSFNSTQSAQKTGWVDVQHQKAAIHFINKKLFDTPYWFIPEKLVMYKPHIGDPRNFRLNPSEYLLNVQKNILDRLLAPDVFYNLLRMENEVDQAYTISDLMADLHGELFKELATNKTISFERMQLHYQYLQSIQQLLIRLPHDRRSQVLSGVPFLIETHLRKLCQDIEFFLSNKSDLDERTKLHFMGLSKAVNIFLKS